MFKNKCLGKKFSDGITIEGVVMKSDWKGKVWRIRRSD